MPHACYLAFASGITSAFADISVESCLARSTLEAPSLLQKASGLQQSTSLEAHKSAIANWRSSLDQFRRRVVARDPGDLIDYWGISTVTLIILWICFLVSLLILVLYACYGPYVEAQPHKRPQNQQEAAYGTAATPVNLATDVFMTEKLLAAAAKTNTHQSSHSGRSIQFQRHDQEHSQKGSGKGKKGRT